MLNDQELMRKDALSHAIAAFSASKADEIVAAANAFYKFLKGE